jgi:NAD(P)-dependent dehydrogenase (short-subunit alcohol dehydrogenase family)
VTQAVDRLQCGGGRGRACGLATDVTDRAQVEALWGHAIASFGRVDVWINNAGVAHTTRSIVETTAADVRTMVSTNLLGTIHGCQVAARGMIDQASGRIFNILGGGSDGEYFPGMGIYGSTKRGLDYLTTALARELAATPVLVGKVRPGMIVTEGVIREIRADPDNFQRSRRIMNTLCDLPDTVAPYLVEQMLAMRKTGGKIAWLSGGKIAKRFLMARFKPRADLFQQAAGL